MLHYAAAGCCTMLHYAFAMLLLCFCYAFAMLMPDMLMLCFARLTLAASLSSASAMLTLCLSSAYAMLMLCLCHVYAVLMLCVRTCALCRAVQLQVFLVQGLFTRNSETKVYVERAGPMPLILTSKRCSCLPAKRAGKHLVWNTVTKF